MASQYTHKVVFDCPGSVFTLRVHRQDDYGAAMARYSDVYKRANKVTVQVYPLRDNPIKVLKDNQQSLELVL